MLLLPLKDASSKMQAEIAMLRAELEAIRQERALLADRVIDSATVRLAFLSSFAAMAIILFSLFSPCLASYLLLFLSLSHSCPAAAGARFPRGGSRRGRSGEHTRHGRRTL
jgi:hypothetical protein